MTTLSSYLPQDRLRALSRGESLPDRTTGAALFADISGFTPLTETLREALGARRGGEELTKQLDAVYTALIRDVEKYGGSVIGFAGDAMTCWFDDSQGPAAPRAVACGFVLQHAMDAFSSIALPNGATMPLTLKVAIATGPARRFVVGSPAVNYLDVLAGATIARMASAEHHAEKGEVLADEATVNLLGDSLSVRQWRSDHASKERFAVVDGYVDKSIAVITPALYRPLDEVTLQAWIHKAVFQRERAGQDSFLTEFRPCAVLFIRFMGIDYDLDEARDQLDGFIQQVQSVAGRYDSTLMDLTIGDKGSYLYLNLGALSAHEDDARRAVKMALELHKATLLQIQIGVTLGTLRVGAMGGANRRTYGALGDDVNLAARLMSTAAPGEILISGRVHQTIANEFVSEPRPPLLMKGKAEPLPIFAVTGERQQRPVRLQEPTYALPMVGRTDELQIINDKLELTLNASGQVIGLVAQAGMGKSRLVAEIIRLAHRKGFTGYGGTCQSDAINTLYLAWKSIWSAFFDVDPSAPLKKQIRLLESEIEDRAPERVQALPLLGALLNLDIPDNDFTRTLEPKYRPGALRALLEDCLRGAAKDAPMLIVIEDLHWIDALSHTLLEEMARLLSDTRVCFVLAYRPPQLARLEVPRLEALPNFTKIELSELNVSEAEQAIRAKLAQLYPARSGAVPAELVQKLMGRSQGNPFYLEELLNFLHDRGLDPRELQALEKIELPDSLHTLILSRIDQLSDREKTVLRVASIIGRLFRAEWLMGYYPHLGEATSVQMDLDQLAQMDITPLDSPQPELAYLFRHIVTHEVTYESLPFATRARLHEQLAAYLERQIAAGVLREAPQLDVLVHHYANSENHVKQREYLRKAVQVAQDISAFNTAVEYLTRLVALTSVTEPDFSILALQLAEAQLRLGDFSAARTAIQRAQAAATTDTDRVFALALLGEMTSTMGEYAEAQVILLEAVPLARGSDDLLALCRTFAALGANYALQGKLDDAQTALNESLVLAHTLGDVTRELFALNRMGVVFLQIDLVEAERIFTLVHTKALAAGNRERAMVALNNLGVVADERQDFVAARKYIQQALAFAREIGAQQSIAVRLINLADADIKLGQLSEARAGLREGLALAQRLGALPLVVAAVTNFASLAHAEGRTDRALALWGMARNHPVWSSDDQRDMDEELSHWSLDAGVMERGLAQGSELVWDTTIQELGIG